MGHREDLIANAKAMLARGWKIVDARTGMRELTPEEYVDEQIAREQRQPRTPSIITTRITTIKPIEEIKVMPHKMDESDHEAVRRALATGNARAAVAPTTKAPTMPDVQEPAPAAGSPATVLESRRDLIGPPRSTVAEENARARALQGLLDEEARLRTPIPTDPDELLMAEQFAKQRIAMGRATAADVAFLAATEQQREAARQRKLNEAIAEERRVYELNRPKPSGPPDPYKNGAGRK